MSTLNAPELHAAKTTISSVHTCAELACASPVPWAPDRSWVYPNAFGCIVMGILCGKDSPAARKGQLASASVDGTLGPGLRAGLRVGLLGSLTTYSAWCALHPQFVTYIQNLHFIFA